MEEKNACVSTANILKMAGLVDIHSHILPGIDDGPGSTDESLEMARTAVAAGIEVLAATPHLRPDFPNVDVRQTADRTQALQAAIDHQGVRLTLVPGGEVSLVWALEASEEELLLASYGQRGRDLLIETPSATAVGLAHMLYALRSKGYRVTLAHPERSPELQRDPSPLVELARQGVLLQVNADSLLARKRRSGPGRLAERLCVEGIAHVLASDGHLGSGWRPVTLLADAVELAESLVGRERAAWMTEDVPAAILAGEPLPEPPAAHPARSRRRWFGRG